MGLLKRLVLFTGIVAAVAGCDQATKSIAKRHLVPGAQASLFGDTVRLQYTENIGAFLGIGASLGERTRTAVFVFGAGLLLLAVVVYLIFSRGLPRDTVVALALICSGGFSNLSDRIAYGGVTDFLNVGIGPLRTGIFNIADVAIMFGAALMLISALRQRPFTPPP